ncbi:O-antigen ligase family protein [Deinococcus ficus]|nr:O-antigen ligase family protein [Deinococcus ficus]
MTGFVGSVFGLRKINSLPSFLKVVVIIFCLSHVGAALLSPSLFTATIWTIFRLFILVGLISYGSHLKDLRGIRFLAIGILASELLAIFFTITVDSGLTSRLKHPYMTSVSLGLVGSFGIWISVLGRDLLWKTWNLALSLLLFSLSTLVVLFSGSRSAVAATIIGLIFAAITFERKQAIKTLFAILIIIAVYILLLGFSNVGFLFRILDGNTSGRSAIWYSALSLIKSQPYSGIGAYQFGNYNNGIQEGCASFNSEAVIDNCRGIIDIIGTPWIITHNATLQELVEFGFLGIASFYVLLGLILYAAIKTRIPLVLAFVVGMMCMSLYDNVLIVPSPFFAEVFWVIGGYCIARVKLNLRQFTAIPFLLFIVISSPVFIMFFPLERNNYLSRLSGVFEDQEGKRNIAVMIEKSELEVVIFECTNYCVAVESNFSSRGLNMISWYPKIQQPTSYMLTAFRSTGMVTLESIIYVEK